MTAPAAGPLRIEYMPLSGLRAAPRNAKTHDLGGLHTSMSRFGYVAPMILNEATGRLVVGHGRMTALRQGKARGDRPPDRVVIRADGEWMAPVLRGVSFDTDEAAEAYLLADNQHTIAGGWDKAVLSAMLQDLAAAEALSGTGFDGDDVDALLQQDDPGLGTGAGPAKPPGTCVTCGSKCTAPECPAA